MSITGQSIVKAIPRPPRKTGGPYEVYVVTTDGFYIAGGNQQYTKRRSAERSANDWLDSRQDARAYVVTL